MTRVVDLIGVNGARHRLVCDPAGPYDLRPDNGLWGMTSYSFRSTRLINVPGERLDDVHPEARTFALPILAKGPNSDLLVDQVLSDLAPILNPEYADVRIIFTRDDGTRREIVARYQSGYEGIGVRRLDHYNHVIPLVFKAYYPFWRTVDQPPQSYAAVFSDAAFGGADPLTATNLGDVRVWPQLEFQATTGPLQNIEAANFTTGQTVRLVEILTAGQKVTIDTDPRSFAVYLDGFGVYASTVDPFSEFWPLEVGVNQLMFRAVGTGTFNIIWEPRYNTP